MTASPSKDEERGLLELLKNAAKAVGYEDVRPSTFASDVCLALIEGEWRPWNPHSEDGDAFRLLATLGDKFIVAVAGIFNRAAFPYASASVVHRDGRETYIEQEIDGNDTKSATRRAIVRAAASIGKDHP